MLRPVTSRLAGRKVILASESPRRKAILTHIGFPFVAVPSQFQENLDKAGFPQPWQYAVENARGKAREVAYRLKEDTSWFVVIGADTIVVKDGVIFEKPKTQIKAQEMLKKLSNDTHEVITGLSLVYRCASDGHENICEVNTHEITSVTIDHLSEEIMSSYIESGEPLYGIQDVGGTLVKSIHGDYYNVVGLPLNRLCTELLKILSQN